MPALPSPGNVLRVHLRWGPSNTNIWGSRFYVSYTGGPPTSTDLNTFCSNVAAHYIATFPAYLNNALFFQEVTALDLSSDHGAEGSWSGSHAGTDSGIVPEDACIVVGFNIGRHYRGGKPKIFLPPAGADSLANDASWGSALITAVNGAWSTFMADILADTYSSMTMQQHVNVGYYHGFTVFTEPSGRARNIPTPRATPAVDTVTGHVTRGLVGSQRRRRTSITG